MNAGEMKSVLAYSPETIAAIGEPDLKILIQVFHEAVQGLEALRTNPQQLTRSELWSIVHHIEVNLVPRLTGIRDAATRQAGGSLGDMAEAMDVPRSTAQTRKEALDQREPSKFERWALGELDWDSEIDD